MRGARHAATLAVVLVAAAIGWAAPPKLDIPAELKPEQGFASYTPPKDVVSIVYISHDGLSLFPPALLKDARSLVVPVKGEPAKRYRFTAVAANGKGEQSRADFVIPIGDAPVPPGPVPPGPTPPAPVTDPNPFGAMPGLRVMIVTESSDNTKLPVGQFLTLQGKKFRDYVDANCASDGYRFLDQNVKFTDGGEPWKTAMSRTDRKSLPWLYVGKEAAGLSAPLPADADATIAAINKFLGK